MVSIEMDGELKAIADIFKKEFWKFCFSYCKATFPTFKLCLFMTW